MSRYNHSYMSQTQSCFCCQQAPCNPPPTHAPTPTTPRTTISSSVPHPLVSSLVSSISNVNISTTTSTSCDDRMRDEDMVFPSRDSSCAAGPFDFAATNAFHNKPQPFATSSSPDNNINHQNLNLNQSAEPPPLPPQTQSQASVVDPNHLNELLSNINLNNQSQNQNPLEIERNKAVLFSSSSSNLSAFHPPNHNEALASPVVVAAAATSPYFGSTIDDNYNQQQSLHHSSSVDVRTNFRLLQTRQLGGRFGGTAASSGNNNNGLSCLSSSAPSMGVMGVCTSSTNNNNITDLDGEAPGRSNNNSTSVDSMDLVDSALDELGMLSTITQSRRDYLVEMRGSASALKRDRRLRSKSESYPNLASRLNGLHLVHADSNFVTGLSNNYTPYSYNSIPGTAIGGSRLDFPTSDNTPLKSQSVRMEYRNPRDLMEASAYARRRRSVPRMSRLRSGRYLRSRCPYKVPNRLCNSMHEGDFDSIGGGSVFLPGCQHALFSSSMTALSDSNTATSLSRVHHCSTPTPNLDLDMATTGHYHGGSTASASSSLQLDTSLNAQHHQLPPQSKSNTNSPNKPNHDPHSLTVLTRSLSVEDLHSTFSSSLLPSATSKLNQNLFVFHNSQEQQHQKSEAEANLAMMSSQLTDLHMS